MDDHDSGRTGGHGDNGDNDASDVCSSDSGGEDNDEAGNDNDDDDGDDDDHHHHYHHRRGSSAGDVEHSDGGDKRSDGNAVEFSRAVLDSDAWSVSVCVARDGSIICRCRSSRKLFVYLSQALRLAWIAVVVVAGRDVSPVLPQHRRRRRAL